MRKLFIALLILCSLQGLTQTTATGDKVIARYNLYLRDWWVDSIKRDTNFLGAVRSLPTADAVYRFLQGRLGSVTTTEVAEGTRLYFTDARARSSISLTTAGTSGAATYNSSTGVLNIPQYAPPPTTLSTLTYGATTTWDYSTQGTEAKVTLTGNTTLSITNLPAGEVVYLTLEVIQDATSYRTLTLPAGTKVIGGGSGSVTLTTTGGATDILTFYYNGTTLYCNIGTNYN